MKYDKPLLGTRKPAQIAIVVNDVEEVKRAYAEFLGVEVPPTVDAGTYEVSKTEYMGKPAPEAGCKMAFFNLETLDLEIIEPNAAQSTWRDFLEEKGEGLHHIAFRVADLHKSIKDCEDFGMKLTQWGYYGDASGCYAYLDACETLGCFIELLQDF